MRKWLIAGGIGGVLVAALLVGSIVMSAFAHDTSARHDTTITPEHVKAVALKDNPDATITGIEPGNENGVLVYDVELSNGMDVEVDAGTCVVLCTEVDSDGKNEVED
uniref:PepSY domain-containing protein n=2 Tax=Methanosarcinales TaxID=94695 RepID=A0A7G9Y4L3_9EURY|nr:hypothetical protein IHLAGKGC_00003 [Methanosarcinales archaeon ANME-2c ERB4]QNT35677.1 hypothetical protein HAHEADPM_00011 [uncultured Methanosarcinales archaeon]